jgi:site-specific DNA-methyltransferase (cytosine-N4-specific)
MPADHPDKADEYGAEETPAEFVANLVATFREVRRVLADDGCVWVNLGDSYYSGKGSPTQPDLKNAARRPPARVLDVPGASWSSPKNLLGIPWRTAFALQDDGWILRNAVCWAKPNAMPESVTDRLSTRYEMLFMLSKSRRYWFDLDPIREDHKRIAAGPKSDEWVKSTPWNHNRLGEVGSHESGRNPGDVWEIPTVGFPGAHFATYPPELVRRCIVSGCKPGGTVLDPFHGSGTTGMVATRGPCPVRDRCLAEALKAETAAGGRHGMWGGLSPDARAQLVKKR